MDWKEQSYIVLSRKDKYRLTGAIVVIFTVGLIIGFLIGHFGRYTLS